MDLDKMSLDYPHMSYYYDFTVYMDAERCCDWIREHKDYPLMPLGEADIMSMENDLRYYGITHG